ncbi:MAG TPA: hypothetical protein VFZ34_11690 [Blastocatellia bacterium]|nr:hypothetical protein [Blastocatellia bacterium]
MPELIVVAENEADARMICALADRVLLEESPAWLDESVLPHIREWTGFENGYLCTRWTAISDLYKTHRLPRYRGHVNGEPQGVDTAIARKAIRLALKLQQQRDIIALVLSRDLDSQHERREGMQQAAAEVEGKFVVAIAAQYPKREAWILNGFLCDNDQEEQRLATVRQRLNFDPCEEAHRLRYSSATSDAARDPKKIIAELEIDFAREQNAWQKVRLDILRIRGENTYLRHYLDEVKDKLLPLLLR